MGVDDPAGTIDLARCGTKIWVGYGKNQKNQKKHQNSSQTEETVMIFGFPALDSPRNHSQRFWNTTKKKIVGLCNGKCRKRGLVCTWIRSDSALSNSLESKLSRKIGTSLGHTQGIRISPVRRLKSRKTRDLVGNAENGVLSARGFGPIQPRAIV